MSLTRRPSSDLGFDTPGDLQTNPSRCTNAGAAGRSISGCCKAPGGLGAAVLRGKAWSGWRRGRESARWCGAVWHRAAAAARGLPGVERRGNHTVGGVAYAQTPTDHTAPSLASVSPCAARAALRPGAPPPAPLPPRHARRRCDALVGEVEAAPHGTRVIQLMDDISDEVRPGMLDASLGVGTAVLPCVPCPSFPPTHPGCQPCIPTPLPCQMCQVCDAAEACRNVHADPAWVRAAGAACAVLGARLAELNQHHGMYAKLRGAMDRCGRDWRARSLMPWERGAAPRVPAWSSVRHSRVCMSGRGSLPLQSPRSPRRASPLFPPPTTRRALAAGTGGPEKQSPASAATRKAAWCVPPPPCQPSAPPRALGSPPNA